MPRKHKLRRLGRVLKLKPEHDGSQSQEGFVVFGTLLIPRSYPTALLETIDEPLDTVALPIRLLVKLASVLFVSLAWNGDANAAFV